MEIPDRVLRLSKENGWIGVDLDGTMFEFTGDVWYAWNVFGRPIEPMIYRVKSWIKAHVNVRIITARIDIPIDYLEPYLYSKVVRHTCRVSGQEYSDAMMEQAIQDLLERHGLPRLKVQPHKGVHMIELWDDRAIQMVANTGRTLAEEHEAEKQALLGKQYNGEQTSA